MYLFLDLASRITGWTAGDGRGTPDCGAWDFPQCGDDLGQMLEVLDNYLRRHIDRYKPTAIGYEAPILVVNSEATEARPARARGKGRGRKGTYTDNLLTVRKLFCLGGHVEFVARKHGLPCHEIGLRTVKKELTGNSLAAKDDMVAVARKVGMTLPPGPGAKDAADAFGGWLVMLRHYQPALSAEWDRRIWSPRSGVLL